MAKRHIVVIGAGFGGLAVARGLRHARDVELTIIDKQNHHLFQPLLYQVATAALSPAEIAAPVRTILRHQRNARVLLDEVVGVDSDARQVRLASGIALGYDELVIATGARHSYFGRDDWAEHAPGIKTIDDATRVRAQILRALERAETERQQMPETRGQQLTFVVIGGGPTGVEMAGAIAELTRHAADLEFRYITGACVRVLLVEAGPRLLASFPEALSAKAKLALEQLGVEVRLGAAVTAIDADSVTVAGQRVPVAATIWAAGVQASPAARWLGVAGDRAGRVPVGPDLTVPDMPNIFVIGDTAMVTGEGGKPVPGVAPAAKQQGHYVARAILARLRGQPLTAPFVYKNYGNLATIGRQRAVADFGWTTLSGYAAWFVWSTAHLYYLADFRSRLIVGAQWMWSYLTFDRGARLITGIDGAMPKLGWTEPVKRAA
ncbi:MAG: NAD(P)/FAD-dependent oxidoreductase [Sphingomonas sp.]|uniref:NAD(P)/FAD-dependent oxidoreductase n=1 Tax=Sphingomonas sp. TaxID=28214 RepID=UPI0025FF6D1B|nr:NAD(P)/FAD-dependent oxidoreductase [Sphingomonas sp.]MBX9882518.1 NAD(P)/FAD-dependent oxidoreductase [Sphingomonas sp.]